MMTVFYVFCCVLCVVVCAKGGWFSWVSAIGSYTLSTTYRTRVVLEAAQRKILRSP
jgi:hypothetical protein